jgi:hypothetical protein
MLLIENKKNFFKWFVKIRVFHQFKCDVFGWIFFIINYTKKKVNQHLCSSFIKNKILYYTKIKFVFNPYKKVCSKYQTGHY